MFKTLKRIEATVHLIVKKLDDPVLHQPPEFDELTLLQQAGISGHLIDRILQKG